MHVYCVPSVWRSKSTGALLDFPHEHAHESSNTWTFDLLPTDF